MNKYELRKTLLSIAEIIVELWSVFGPSAEFQTENKLQNQCDTSFGESGHFQFTE